MSQVHAIHVTDGPGCRSSRCGNCWRSTRPWPDETRAAPCRPTAREACRGAPVQSSSAEVRVPSDTSSRRRVMKRVKLRRASSRSAIHSGSRSRSTARKVNEILVVRQAPSSLDHSGQNEVGAISDRLKRRRDRSGLERRGARRRGFLPKRRRRNDIRRERRDRNGGSRIQDLS